MAQKSVSKTGMTVQMLTTMKVMSQIITSHLTSSLLGDEEGQELGIDITWYNMFVNKTGDITWYGKSSSANDEELINEQWEIANQD